MKIIKFAFFLALFWGWKVQEQSSLSKSVSGLFCSLPQPLQKSLLATHTAINIFVVIFKIKNLHFSTQKTFLKKASKFFFSTFKHWKLYLWSIISLLDLQKNSPAVYPTVRVSGRCLIPFSSGLYFHIIIDYWTVEGQELLHQAWQEGRQSTGM